MDVHVSAHSYIHLETLKAARFDYLNVWHCRPRYARLEIAALHLVLPPSAAERGCPGSRTLSIPTSSLLHGDLN